jgi:hypothetical protein
MVCKNAAESLTVTNRDAISDSIFIWGGNAILQILQNNPLLIRYFASLKLTALILPA